MTFCESESFLEIPLYKSSKDTLRGWIASSPLLCLRPRLLPPTVRNKRQLIFTRPINDWHMVGGEQTYWWSEAHLRRDFHRKRTRRYQKGCDHLHHHAFPPWGHPHHTGHRFHAFQGRLEPHKPGPIPWTEEGSQHIFVIPNPRKREIFHDSRSNHSATNHPNKTRQLMIKTCPNVLFPNSHYHCKKRELFTRSSNP